MGKSKEQEAPTGRLKAHQSIAWAAIAKHGAKEQERSTLPPGSHTVQLDVSGTAGGRPFRETIAGTLTVAPDGTRDLVEAAPVGAVVAWILAEVCKDEAQRAKVLNRLPSVWQDELPKLTAAEIEQADELLGRLRARTGTAPKNGDVRFTPQV